MQQVPSFLDWPLDTSSYWKQPFCTMGLLYIRLRHWPTTKIPRVWIWIYSIQSSFFLLIFRFLLITVCFLYNFNIGIGVCIYCTNQVIKHPENYNSKWKYYIRVSVDKGKQISNQTILLNIIYSPTTIPHSLKQYTDLRTRYGVSGWTGMVVKAFINYLLHTKHFPTNQWKHLPRYATTLKTQQSPVTKHLLKINITANHQYHLCKVNLHIHESYKPINNSTKSHPFFYEI